MDNNQKENKDALLLFSPKGEILSANPRALQLLSLEKKDLKNSFNQFLMPFARKRLAIHAKQKIAAALKGIPQEFVWVEYSKDKPILAFALLINLDINQKKPTVMVKLIDITQEKIQSWALWSLAKLPHHAGVNEMLDYLVILMYRTFNADIVSINLIDNVNYAHTLSYLTFGKKQSATLFNLKNTPSEHLKQEKKLIVVNKHAQKKFPEDALIKTHKIDGYLSSPLISSGGDVIGQIILMSQKPINYPPLLLTLLQLFSDRVTLEIERLLHERKLQFLASFPQQSPNPIMRLLSNGTVLYANTPGKDILHAWKQQHKGLPETLTQAIKRCLENKQILYQELEVNDTIYLFTLVWLEEFNQINIYGTDITLLKNTEREIKNLAQYDSLTQVANRQYCLEKLNELLKHAKRDTQPFGVLLLDLDNFKTVNDTLGHPIGDKLLKTVTRRMAGCLRQDDFIARLGGDEFVVLLKGATEESAVMIADKINKQLATRFQIGEYHINIAASIGIAIYPEGGQTATELLKHADVAMYQAKNAGGDQCMVVKKSNNHQLITPTVLKKDIKQALMHQQFHMHYQPQFNLVSNQIIGYEAFLRWAHPKQGEMKPREFLINAEQNGTLLSIGQWSMEQAIRDFSTTIWTQSSLPLSLNISLAELQHPDFLVQFENLFKQYRVDPHHIILDIPEKILLSPYKSLHPVLASLKDLGVRLSLDNFGGLLTPFNRLIELPISLIKIDEELLKDINTQQKHVQLLKGIIDFAKDIGYEIIQKGVEEASHNHLLKTIGCPNAQGFYYAKPMPLSQLFIL